MKLTKNESCMNSSKSWRNSIFGPLIFDHHPRIVICISTLGHSVALPASQSSHYHNSMKGSSTIEDTIEEQDR